MNELKFKPGDVVKHKASELKMVVKFIHEESTKDYKCSWYDPSIEGKYQGFHYHVFNEVELKLIEP